MTLEKLEDDFGLLPFEFNPSLFAACFGAKSFTVHPEFLDLRVDRKSLRLPYSSIENVSQNGSSILLALCENGNPKNLELKIGSRNEAVRLKALMDRLLCESRRISEILKAPAPIASLGASIDECLSFRGEPFVAAAEALVAAMVREKASDLHLEPLTDRIRITVRIARVLYECGCYSKAQHEGLCTRLKFLAGCHSHRSGIAQEGAWSLPNKNGEIRLSVFPAVDGERIALRIIRPIEFLNLPSLGWPQETVNEWRNLLKSGPGLSLIVGPIGSGKTTALYATLAELASSTFGELRRVATLEDPVEGRVPGVCQAALGTEAGTTLDSAFKHLLRQDPDVMALGEIRDAASLREALQAGLAGHLVLATFHAADADGAMERLARFGLDQSLVATSLKGILSVRLEKGMKQYASLSLAHSEKYK